LVREYLRIYREGAVGIFVVETLPLFRDEWYVSHLTEFVDAGPVARVIGGGTSDELIYAVGANWYYAIGKED
jgi:hypothetical protein